MVKIVKKSEGNSNSYVWFSVKEFAPEPEKLIMIARKSGSMSGWSFIMPTVGIIFEKDSLKIANKTKYPGCFDLIKPTHWMYIDNPID